MQAKNWYAVSVLVDSAACEAIEFGFNELDADGTEIDGLVNKTSATQTVVGYFEAEPDIEAVRSQLESALAIYGFTQSSLRDISLRTVENADWLAEWKKHWKPTIVGKFLIAAPWHELDEDQKIVIRIEPNMAFGTGTHETTRLCLAAIDNLYKSGESFLDVGTGTGILSIAAAGSNLRSHSSNFRSQISNIKSQVFDFRSLAIDNDSDAIKIAKENAAANGVGGMIDFRTGQLGPEQTKFDFVCANLTLDVILPILPQLIEKTGRILVLSGILTEQEEIIFAELNNLNATRLTINREGEWIAVIVSNS